jgi:hypothetical protein
MLFWENAIASYDIMNLRLASVRSSCVKKWPFKKNAQLVVARNLAGSQSRWNLTLTAVMLMWRFCLAGRDLKATHETEKTEEISIRRSLWAGDLYLHLMFINRLRILIDTFSILHTRAVYTGRVVLFYKGFLVWLEARIKVSVALLDLGRTLKLVAGLAGFSSLEIKSKAMSHYWFCTFASQAGHGLNLRLNSLPCEGEENQALILFWKKWQHFAMKPSFSQPLPWIHTV